MNNSNQKTLSVTLYQDKNPRAARSIYVNIKDGLVTFGLQDLGPLCDEMFGDSEYERVIFGLPVEQLRAALQVSTDEQLLEALKQDYNTADAFSRFVEFVSDNKMEFKIYCG